MGVELRDYKSTDFRKINSLWLDTGMTSERRADSPESIERTLDHGGAFYVLEEEGEVIGTLWVTFDGRRSYLHHLVVHPNHRDKGHAKNLLKKALEFTEEKGCQVKLEVHDENVAAIGLYEKHGFRKLNDHGVYLLRNFRNI